MLRASVFIPEPDRLLLQRCRHLKEDLAGLERVLPEPEVIALLARLPLYELPRSKRKQIACILRLKSMQDEKRAELNKIIVKAEIAAHRIEHEKLRRVVKLYCLDGLSIADTAKDCPCSERTVRKYVKLLSKSPACA